MVTFVLDSKLESKDYAINDNAKYLTGHIKDLIGKNYEFMFAPYYGEGVDQQDNLLYMLSKAYKNHLDVVINPHDLWYMVLVRLAELVNAKPEVYRDIFTNSPDKQDIVVLNVEEGYLPVDRCIFELKRRCPVDVGLFMPRFSGLTDKAELACMAAFCDMVKSYYNFMVMACGIRSVTINGTLDDWNLFGINLEKIAAQICKANSMMEPWFEKVYNRIVSIANSLDGGLTDFYRDIYRQKNIGSGSQFEVTGWITEFTSGTGRASAELSNFSKMWSVIPFTSLDTGLEYVNVWGGFKSKNTPNGLEMDYDCFGFQKVGVQQDSEMVKRVKDEQARKQKQNFKRLGFAPLQSMGIRV